MNISIKKEIYIPFFISTLIFLTNYIDQNIFYLSSIIYSIYLIFRSRIETFIGLFILFFYKKNFFRVDNLAEMTTGNFEAIASVDGFIIAGFPLNVPTLASVIVAARVIYEFIYHPKTFSNKVSSKLIYSWLLLLIPAIILFFYSYSLQNPNWTRGFRFFMITSCYFYGFILEKNYKYSSENILKIFFPFITIILVFMNLNFYWSHLGFLFLAISSSFSIYFLFQKQSKIIGLLLLSLSITFVIKSTLTLILICLFSLLTSFLINSKKGFFKDIILRFGFKNVIPLVLVFTFGIIYIGYYFNISDIALVGVTGELDQRFLFKTFIDRLPFWVAAYEQILEGPYIFTPSGRPFYIDMVYYGKNYEWTVGAHNVILETIRNTGFIVGGYILIIFFTAVKNNLKLIFNSNDKILKTLSSCLVVTAVVGGTVGDFPADMIAGFFLWSILGFTYSKYLSN